MTEQEFIASILERRAKGMRVDIPKTLAFKIPEPQPTQRQIEEKEQFAKTDRENAEQLRRVVAIRRMAAAAGERYRSCTFDSYQLQTAKVGEYQRKVVAKVREYANTIDRRAALGANLILHGPVGTGKDHLAFCVARVAILKFGLSVGWHNGQNWFGRNRDRIDEGGSEDAFIREFRLPDVVVLSDPLPPIGTITPYQAAMLYRAIDARSARNLPTIVTVNVVDDAEADTRLGVPTWDRLKGGAWMFSCAWPSFRQPEVAMSNSGVCR